MTDLTLVIYIDGAIVDEKRNETVVLSPKIYVEFARLVRPRPGSRSGRPFFRKDNYVDIADE